jgi:hypothetical protein
MSGVCFVGGMAKAWLFFDGMATSVVCVNKTKLAYSLGVGS